MPPSRHLPPDHPQRLPMTQELHARPFPPLSAPGQAIQLAFKPLDDRIRDTSAHRDHLERLVAFHRAPRPDRDSAHYYGEVGRLRIKWERHTEYVSYTLFEEGAGEPFSLSLDRLAPPEWLADAPGALLSAIRIHIEPVESEEAAEAALIDRWQHLFTLESLAAAHLGEGQATAVGDFRIDADGFTRFVVLAGPRAGSRRLGRIVQRLIEVENYRMLSMLALPVARRLSEKLGEIEAELTTLIGGFSTETHDDQATLGRLTRLSAAIEALSAESAFRFAASNAYAALVDQRIEVLREARAADRQLLSEFMARRFKPAMRTWQATERRLADVTGRAARGVALLSARVNVAVERQNQDLLESMNRRAETQLRLQRTVEGLSVVAISYYAVGLTAYLLKPLAKSAGIDEATMIAVVAVPVILVVQGFLRRIRREMEHD